MVKTEGFLSGGSCGAVLEGAFKYLKENNLHEDESLRCVCLLPD